MEKNDYKYGYYIISLEKKNIFYVFKKKGGKYGFRIIGEILINKLRYYEKEEIPIVDISYANDVVISIRCGFEKFEEVTNSTVSITASRAVITKTGEAYCLHNN